MNVVTHFSYRYITQNLKTGFDEERIDDGLLQRIIDYIQSWFITSVELQVRESFRLPEQIFSAVITVDSDHEKVVNLKLDRHYSIEVFWNDNSQNFEVSLKYNNWISKTKTLLLINKNNYDDFVASALVKMISNQVFEDVKKILFTDLNSSCVYEVFQTYLVENPSKRKNFLIEQEQLLKSCTDINKLRVVDSFIYYGNIIVNLEIKRQNI